METADNIEIPASRTASTHPHLDKTKRQIRLLSIKEDEDGKLACEASVFEISHCPEFIALSYVWGSPDVQHEITLNGLPFMVRDNLYRALRSIAAHLKKSSEECVTRSPQPTVRDADDCPGLNKFTPSAQIPRNWSYFWIDAICINQNETSERTHQVRMMSDIYKTASFVLVWLGLGCEEALRLIAHTHKDNLAALFGPYTPCPDRVQRDHPLRSILMNVYWQRMWIVQEFVLAQDLLLASGSCLVPWDHADHMIPDIYEYYGGGSIQDLPVQVVNERRKHKFRRRHGLRSDLCSLILRFQNMCCHDVRDKVFALYGLLEDDSDGRTTRFIVNYALTPAQLVYRVVKMVSKITKDEQALSKLHALLNDALKIDASTGAYSWNCLRSRILFRETVPPSLKWNARLDDIKGEIIRITASRDNLDEEDTDYDEALEIHDQALKDLAKKRLVYITGATFYAPDRDLYA